MNAPSELELCLLRLIAGGIHLPMMISAEMRKRGAAMTTATAALRQMQRHGWIRGVKARGWFLTDAGRALLPQEAAPQAPPLPVYVPPRPLPIRPGGEDYKRCRSINGPRE